MKIAVTRGHARTSRAKGKTRGGKVKRAHNVGKTYRNKRRGR